MWFVVLAMLDVQGTDSGVCTARHLGAVTGGASLSGLYEHRVDSTLYIIDRDVKKAR